eukprot:scaffold1629_cov73-Skeletonema_dohrnii-CCMP3373.AAC.1
MPFCKRQETSREEDGDGNDDDGHNNATTTTLEDARAEYLYQKCVGFEDVGELVGLLRETKVALDSWFGFIRMRISSLHLRQ